VTEKKTDVWMPIWIGAYLADTMKLTTVQHGAYFLLLIAYWRERKPLADVDDELRSITKLDRSDWKKVKPVLAQFFKVGDGVWWHKRVEEEMVEADKRAKAASGKATKGAEARWGKRPKDASSNAPSMPEALPDDVHDQCPPPSPTPLPSVDSEANASAADAAAPAVDKSDEKPKKAPEELAKADVWRAAVDVLQAGGCKVEATCRSFMGKLVTDYTFEVVRDAVAAAATAQPADAREYLKATCMRMKGERAADHGKSKTTDGESTEAYIARMAEVREAVERDKRESAASKEVRDQILARHKSKVPA
jgi:uncharacterized protein YdaU (DUF1376 family)